MPSTSEVIFDSNAEKAGWVVLSSGWPTRLVVKPDGVVCCWLVKNSSATANFLRPSQVKLIAALKKAGISTFVSVSGELTEIDASQLATAAYERGRPFSKKPIAQATRRQYGYKILVLQGQIDQARRVEGFPRERIEFMEARLASLQEKIKEYELIEERMLTTATVEQREELSSQSKAMFEIAATAANQLGQSLLAEMEEIAKSGSVPPSEVANADAAPNPR